jgi:beta-glucosidase
MKLVFPSDFEFGTSTAAYQIETGIGHDWCGVRSRDGHIFECTTDHEKHYERDIDIITSLAPCYRMSLMWSRLQREPFAAFDPDTTTEYHQLLSSLKRGGASIMMVLHHFGNASWFARNGGWEKEENISQWIDFAKKLVDEFGVYVSRWNTFNEPNLYVSMGWCLGEFPPFKKNMLLAKRVIRNMGKAHTIIFDYIHEKYPHSTVGISHNCAVFSAENVVGEVTARFTDWWYMEFLPEHFQKTDFFGMSYYARVGFDPAPVTYLTSPEKIKKQKKQHDDMWEYYPQGLGECLLRYWNKFRKPIIITENGICTSDDTKRVKAICDYMKVIHDCLNKGVDIRGYYHWSTWDNFEWSLGPTYKFGLYSVDPTTKARAKKRSADIYSALAFTKEIEIPTST